MKKIVKSVIMLVISMIVSAVAFAQNKTTKVKPLPNWLSDKGFWVIESNIKTPKHSVIHFYNTDKIEIYSQKVDGVILNIEKRKTLRRLKKSLEESLVAWQKSQPGNDTVQVVKNIIRLR